MKIKINYSHFFLIKWNLISKFNYYKNKVNDFMDQNSNPAIEKLIGFAKTKPFITWDDVTEFLGQEFVNSPEMTEGLMKLLNDNNIQLVEDEPITVEDEVVEDVCEDDEILLEIDDVSTDENKEIEKAEKKITANRNKLVNSDKESSVDDPIRLYLREIGKEKLLTAEEEVKLSKQMENGKNIIKDVIRNSGIMIPEFFAVAQKEFTRIDLHEPGKARKEINEEMAEKRRLKSCYSEYIKPVLPEMKQYMALKKQLFENDQTSRIFDDKTLVALRKKIQPQLQKI